MNWCQIKAKQDALLDKEFTINIPTSSDVNRKKTSAETAIVGADWWSGSHEYNFGFEHFAGVFPDQLEFRVYVSSSSYSPSSLEGVFLTRSWAPFGGIQTHLEQAQFFISGSNYYTATLHWVYVEQMVVGSVIVDETYYKALGIVKHAPEDPSFVTAVLSYVKK